MTIGPATDDEAAAIVAALQAGKVNIVVAGYWAIVAYEGDQPTSEGQAWLLKHPRRGPIDLACPVDDRAVAESILAALGFRLSEEGDRNLQLKDEQDCVVNLWLFRQARDGGRVYDGGGITGEDWYYPPESVTTGRLGKVEVRTEGPGRFDRTRAALPSDL